MKMYYLVYLPCLRILLAAPERYIVVAAHKHMNVGLDEDYTIMDEKEFIKLVQGIALAKEDLA